MRRGAVVAIAAAAAAVLVGVGVAVWLVTRPSAPDATVTQYLDALAAGDGMRAVELLDEGSDAGLAGALGGAVGRISGARVDSVDIDGAAASAAVSFELAGEPRTAQLSLVRRDERWFIGADGVGSLTPTAALGGAVLIGDVAVNLGTARLLLPAEYDVRAAPADVLVGSTPAVVLPGESASVEVPAALSPDATAVAQEQLDAYQDTCTQPATAVPRNCGLRVPWAADLAVLQTLAWRIEQRPAITLSPEAGTFAATGGIVVATATGVTPGNETASFTYRAEDWALRGSVSFTADAMTLAVD